MLTAIGYGRFSSDMQREESITAQKRAIDEYCEKNDIVLVDFFADQGISGMTDARPGFQAMILAAEHVDMVIVHKLDRFARSRHDSIVYQKVLEKAGTKLISVLEHFDDSPESIILQSVIVGMNEYYSRNLSREVKKGQLETARQGKHAGGTPPLGYDLQDGRYIINPAEAAIVRRIFRATLDGVSYTDLARELNAKGHLSKARRPFGRNSFYDLLRNEKYIGTYIYNVSDSSSATGKRNYHKRHPEEKVIRIPDAIPPIISKEDFYEVRKIMSARKKGLHKSVSYLLSGLAHCGECGAPMNGSVTKKPGKSYYYYKCNARCGNRRIRADLLDGWISQMIADLLIHPDNINTIIDRAMVLAQESQKPDALQSIARQEKDLQRKIDNLVMAIADAYSPALKSKLDDLESDLQHLQHEKRQLQATAQKSREEYVELFRKFAEFDILPAQQKKMLIPALITKIKVHHDHQITVDLRHVPLTVAEKVGADLVQKGGGIYRAHFYETEAGSRIVLVAA